MRHDRLRFVAKVSVERRGERLRFTYRDDDGTMAVWSVSKQQVEYWWQLEEGDSQLVVEYAE